MSRILDFELRCLTPNCPGCGLDLRQLQYTVAQVRGLLDAGEAVNGYCAYGDHQWPIVQQLREELRART